jgi:hypothetical protein
MRKYAIIVALFLLAGTTGAASRVEAAPALSAGGVPAEHIAPGATGPDCFVLTYEDPCAQSSTGCLGGRNSCPSNVQVLMTFGHNRPINLGVDTAANCPAAGYCEAAVPAFTGTPAPMVAQFACREDDEACMNRLGAGLKQTP